MENAYHRLSLPGFPRLLPNQPPPAPARPAPTVAGRMASAYRPPPPREAWGGGRAGQGDDAPKKPPAPKGFAWLADKGGSELAVYSNWANQVGGRGGGRGGRGRDGQARARPLSTPPGRIG